jgi:dihydrofolate synthase/folylpolyglutamate synthase
MAFHSCERRGVDFSIYEVGLGGRLDATNIVMPEVAIITPLDFDHENFLGHSIEEIAAEKAGIIKAGAFVVSACERSEAREVISRRSAEMAATLVEIDEAWRIEQVASAEGWYRAVAFSQISGEKFSIAPALAGRFQIRNALAAATAAELLCRRGFAVTREAIERGIAEARWAGRLERLSRTPDVYLDGAHNPAGARELRKFWDENFLDRRIILVYGAMRDKAVDEISGVLFPRADVVILTEPRQSRAISAPLLAEMTGGLAKDSRIVPDPAEALEQALRLARPEDAIFVTGSLYLVGELRSYWSKRSAAD